MLAYKVMNHFDFELTIYLDVLDGSSQNPKSEKLFSNVKFLSQREKNQKRKEKQRV